MSLIFEISKLLVSLHEISKGGKQTKVEFLKSKYQSRKYSDEITDFNTVLNFSDELDLIKIENEHIFFMKNGKKLLEKILKRNSGREQIILNLNLIEKNFLRKIFFESKKITQEFLEIINLFWVDETQKKPALIYILKKEDEFNKILIKFLQEIKIFERQNKKIICVDGLIEISKIKNKVSTVSEEEFFEHLEENKRIGKLGEKYAIEKEEERLKNDEKRVDLSLDIKQVSLTNVYIGYDLKSYNNSDSSLTKHDRMIEVKATKNSNPRFYWSTNEVNKAEKLGEKYWIYLWLNVESEERELLKIPNPYKKFFKINTTKPPCTGYFLDENLIEAENKK